MVIRGKVRRGKDRGKKLGFPTANINLWKTIDQGVYISTTTVDETTYPSLTFIGSAKTFGEKEYRAESYLFSFNRNIYGKFITIRLLKKLRANITFSSVDDLVAQMKKDESRAKKYFRLVP